MKTLIKNIGRIIILWFILGCCYADLELLYRGFTYVQMIWVGGMAALCIGLLNQPYGKFKLNFKIWQQFCIGTAITLIIEFVSGCILNKIFCLNLWDYSNKSFNLYGEICLQNGVLCGFY